MCDNAISKQIRHILSHNFPLVQFIPVMLSCVGYTSTFCFMVLLFFYFFSRLFARSNIECFSAYNYYTRTTNFVSLFLRGIIEPMLTSVLNARHFYILIPYYSCTMFVIWHDYIRFSEFNTTSFAVKT